jgi:hypothetical protein
MIEDYRRRPSAYDFFSLVYGYTAHDLIYIGIDGRAAHIHIAFRIVENPLGVEIATTV